jgi:DNA-binding transcriptional ArsR family regulator
LQRKIIIALRKQNMNSTDFRPELAPAKRRNLPRAILLGIDAALHIKNLPRRLRMTLAEIGRHVSQYAATSGTIWPSKEKIADALGYTARTIYRHLADLEEMQLIRRIPPKRTPFQTGSWHTNGHIALTEKGADLLGLTGQVIHIPTDKTALPIKKITVPTSTKNHPPAASKIPEDLKLLEEGKVSQGGIFGLMGEATAKGHRLGDIVAVIGERLREMRKGGLHNYLRKCIYGPTDWSAKAQALRHKALSQQYANRRYTGEGGIVVRVFDGMAEVSRDGVWLEYVTARFIHKVYSHIECGKLREIAS